MRNSGSSIATRRNASSCASSSGCSPCLFERLALVAGVRASAGPKVATVHHALSSQVLSSVKVRFAPSRTSVRTPCSTSPCRSILAPHTTISRGHAASARSQRRTPAASSSPRLSVGNGTSATSRNAFGVFRNDSRQASLAKM